MTEPGWHHSEGDPVGTVRYWDGETWVGEATTNASASGQVYYAAAPQTTLIAGEPMDSRSAGVHYRTAVESAPVTPPPVRVESPAIPASAQLIAVGLSVLKAIPLAYFFLNTILVAVFGTIALQVRYNPDVETVLAFTIGASMLFVVAGAALVAAQASGAARNRPVRLLVPAEVMTCIDGYLTLAGWANEHSTDHFFYTGLLALQTWVLIGAIIGVARKAA